MFKLQRGTSGRFDGLFFLKTPLQQEVVLKEIQKNSRKPKNINLFNCE